MQHLFAADLAGNPVLVALASGLVSGTLAFVGTVFNGKIVVPTFIWKQEKAGREKWEEEAMRLNALIQEKAIPALLAAAATQDRYGEALEKSTLALHDLEQDMQRRRQ